MSGLRLRVKSFLLEPRCHEAITGIKQGTQRTGSVRRWCVVVDFVCWRCICRAAKEILATSTVGVRPLQDGVSLRRARELRRQGALSLAEALILSEQPDPGSPQWYAWEHELWEVLGRQQRWRSLIVRLEHTLPLLSAGRARNARLLLAALFTAVGEYVSARHG